MILPSPRAALIALSLLLSAGAVVACGGGSGGGGTSTIGGVPATSSPCPAGDTGVAPNCTVSTGQTDSFTPTSVATTAPLPSFGGYSGTITVPPAAVASAIGIQTTTTAPTGVTPLFRGRVRAQSAPANVAPLLYITLTVATGSTTFIGFPGFTISLPSSVTSEGPFYLAQLENNIWTTIAGPQNESNGSVMLQPQISSLTITPTASADFVLYVGGGVIPSPVPTSSPGGQPTASASPGNTPTPPPGSSPSPSASPSPTTSPTLAPTPSSTPSSTPTPFPTPVPTATPTPGSGTAQTPSTFVFGSVPSGEAGTALTSSSGTLGLTVKNSTGATITGTFSQTVTLTSSSSDAPLSIIGGATGTSITIPNNNQFIYIAYDGTAIGPVTIAASASGATTATTTFTPTIDPVVYSGPLNTSNSPEIDLYATSGTGSSATFTVSQNGYSGSTYTNTIGKTVPSACNGFASISTGAVSSSGTTYTVSSIGSPAVGSCTLTLNGFGTTTTSVVLTYTTDTVTLQ